MIPLLAVILGLLIGLFVTVTLPNIVYTYIALIILCTFDSLIGGIRARYANRYSTQVFLTGWLSNILVALIMNALGDALGIDLAIPVIILLGMRIFNNVAKLRRLWLRRVEKRQRTIRVWLEKTGQSPEELPIEAVSGEITERQRQVDELRSRARRLRLEADSLLTEADVLFEEEAIAQLLRQKPDLEIEEKSIEAEEGQTPVDREAVKPLPTPPEDSVGSGEEDR